MERWSALPSMRWFESCNPKRVEGNALRLLVISHVEDNEYSTVWIGIGRYWRLVKDGIPNVDGRTTDVGK